MTAAVIVVVLAAAAAWGVWLNTRPSDVDGCDRDEVDR
jgi:hypothetical protein